MRKTLALFLTLGLLVSPLALAQTAQPVKEDAKLTSLKNNVAQNPSNAAAHFDLAMYYFNKAQDKLAQASFFKALELGYKDPAEVHSKISETFHYLRQYEKGISHAEKAVGMAPSNAKYLNNLGVLNYQIGKHDAAIEAYKKALLLDDKKPLYLSNMGQAHFAKKQYKEAESFFQKALKLDANYHKAHYYLGRVDNDNKKYDEAINHYTVAASLKPKDFYTFLDKGIAHYNKKDYTVAEAELRKAFQINSNPSTKIHYWLGISLVHQKDKAKVKQGIEYLKQEIVFAPNDQYAHYHLGFAYWRDGKFNEATTHLLKVLQKQHDNPDVNYYLGSSYLFLKYHGLAKDYLKKAVDLDPKFYAANAELGLAYLKLKNYPFAMNHLKVALNQAPATLITYAEKFNPKDIVYHRIGLTHFEQKQYAECIKAYNQAIAIYAKDAAYYTTRGACYFESGNNQSALTDYKKSVELNPNKETVHYNLALVYMKMNDSHSAEKHYQILVKMNSQYAASVKAELDKKQGQSF